MVTPVYACESAGQHKPIPSANNAIFLNQQWSFESVDKMYRLKYVKINV